MSTLPAQYLAGYAPPRRGFPWMPAFITLALAVGAWGLWAIFLYDPSPPVGTQLVTRYVNAACNDLPSLNNYIDAARAHDQPRVDVLTSSGQCVILPDGVQMKILAHGRIHPRGGDGPAVQVLPPNGKAGWIFVPSNGL